MSLSALQTSLAASPMQETWSDRWLAVRDRWLASPRFQKWAATFPFTRRIARGHARELFDLCAGFVYSQVLLACVELRLFDVLAEGPKVAADVAARVGLPVTSAERLLGAATALKLIERRSGQRYGLGMLGAALRGNPAVIAMIEHHPRFYRDLNDPVALLRGAGHPKELSRWWAYATHTDPAALDDSAIAEYTRLMSRSQGLVAEEILDAYPMHSHDCVLDVGGGEGTFLLAAAARAPRTRLLLFDLPAVVARAEARFAALGLTSRSQVTGGSFLTDPLPTGAGLVTLIRVLHDHDDAAALTLLRRIHAALPRAGTLLIAEPLRETPGAEAVGAAYFEFYFLAMGQGHARTTGELDLLLQQAGFSRPRMLATRQPLQAQLLVAERR